MLMCVNNKFGSDSDFKGEVGDEDEVVGKCPKWWILNGPEMLYFLVENWKFEGLGAPFQRQSELKHWGL